MTPTQSTEKQDRAIIAFARGEKLSAAERLKFAQSFGDMGHVRAWSVVKAYAIGELEEVGDDLEEITHAWLVLGEKQFQIIFQVVRIVTAAIEEGLRAVEDFIRRLKRVFPKVSRQRLSREVEIVRVQLCLSAFSE